MKAQRHGSLRRSGGGRGRFQATPLRESAPRRLWLAELGGLRGGRFCPAKADETHGLPEARQLFRTQAKGSMPASLSVKEARWPKR